MEIIYTSGNLGEAHILKGLLNSHGVDAHVGGSHLQGGIGDLSAMDFINIKVAESDVGKARVILSDYENKPPSTKPTKTLYSKKTTITTKLILATLAIVVTAALSYLAVKS